MRSISIAITLALALGAAACKKDGGGGLAALEKEACACKTAACADAVNKKLAPYEAKFEKQEPTKEEAAAGERIEACLASAMSGGGAGGGGNAASGGAAGDLPTKEQFQAMDCTKVCDGQVACMEKFGTPGTDEARKTCVDGCTYMQNVKKDSYDPAKDGEPIKRFLAFAEGKCE